MGGWKCSSGWDAVSLNVGSRWAITCERQNEEEGYVFVSIFQAKADTNMLSDQEKGQGNAEGLEDGK